MTASYSEQLAQWANSLKYERIPENIIQTTKLRILDVIGLALAGSETSFGVSLRRAMLAMSPGGPSRLLGTGERTSVTGAAFANGAMAQALEYDDTHNESIVHMSGPSVAAALALSETIAVSGRRLITAVVMGNEISCRVGVVAPGRFHRLGFHPTGLFAAFGAAYLAGSMLELTTNELVNAAGIAGSFAAGILECWVDGTQSKFLHPGWAAQSGITAAHIARAGGTGPMAVFEGRFGLFRSHLQDPGAGLDFDRIVSGLGTHWESAKASFKPYPAAHVIHPYIDALLRLRREHSIAPNDVCEISCDVAPFIIPVVCEPVAEKRRPRSDSHGRVSLQYTLAEAFFLGQLGKNAYQEAALGNSAITALADRVTYRADPSFPGPERFKGVVRVTLNNGIRYEAIEENNRGSAANPMTDDELIAKFEENAASVLSRMERSRLAKTVSELEAMADASELISLSIRG